MTGTHESSGRLHWFSFLLFGDLLVLLKTRFVTVQGFPCPWRLFLGVAPACSEVPLITSPPTGVAQMEQSDHIMEVWRPAQKLCHLLLGLHFVLLIQKPGKYVGI